jgi:pimeloyl-ACP methyl ester carboxylesterase
MRKLALTLAAATAAATLTVGAVEPAAGAPVLEKLAPAATIDWGSCADPGLRSSGAQCGFLSVPLDYAHPGGRHIKIAVSRVRHTASPYRGVALVNPGGPGGSGLGYATLGQSIPAGVGDRFDWIGFDPRGVGSSRPAMHCIPHYFHVDRPDYRPRTAHLVKVWKSRSNRYADACADNHPRLIRHMRTVDVARDMNRIRKALGVTRITYYGFSYGTYLGQVFATLFPGRISRMVLDSNVNPGRVWYPANLDQDVAFDRNINIWFRWIARYHATYHLGDTGRKVRRHWYAALNHLAAHPAGGKLGPDEWTDAYLYAGYYQSTWLGLARAFARYAHDGNWQATLSYYRLFNDTSDDNGFAVYNAVQCTDAPWPQHWSTWRQDADRIYDTDPFLVWANTWFNAPCLYWHAPSRHRLAVDGGAVEALLVGGTRDAATPFSGSLAVRRLFPQSSLIAVDGGFTHADTLSGNGCVDKRIAAFLDTGVRPARKDGDRADLVCAAPADPRPGG